MEEQHFNWDLIARDESTPRFPPQLARDMLNLGLTGGRVNLYDPFMGNGTILLQATLSHRKRLNEIYGLDVNPQAVAAAQLNLDQFGKGIEYHVQEGNCFSTCPIQPNGEPLTIITDPPFGRRCLWTEKDGTRTTESKVDKFLRTFSGRAEVVKIVLCLDPEQKIGTAKDTGFGITGVEDKKDRRIYVLAPRY